MTAFAVLTVLPAAAASAAETDRIAGNDRIGTALSIAERAFPDGAATVYLARADVLSDALVAGTLTDGPILLVPPCGDIPPGVTAQVEQLAPQEVVALGGDQAVCDATLDTLGGDAGTSRLAGDSRTATAVAIARRTFPDGADTVYLADAADSPDAVAGGSLTDGPILLVPPFGSPDPAVVETVAALDPAEVVALGGTAAVGDDVLAAASAGRPVGRLAGPSRFDTAAAIAGRSFPTGAAVVYLARADVFADAVAAGTLTDGPVLLVPSCGALPQPVTDAVARLAPATVVALGGTAAVCDDLLATAAGQQPPPPGDALGPIAYESTTVPPGALESVTNIWTIQPDGTNAQRLTTTSGIENRQRRPKWSPDGRYLAWLDVGANDEFGSTDLMVIDTTDPALTPRLVFDDVATFEFDCTDFRYDYVWSHDASTVAVRCMAEPAGYSHSLAVVRVDGSAATVIPFSGPDVLGIVSVALSPDGSRAIYTEASDTLSAVRVADVSAGPVPGAEFGISGDDLLWSPTGDLIAYAAGSVGTEIRVVAPDGADDRPVATSPDYIAPAGWSPDGTALYAESIVQDPPGTYFGAVERVDVATGARAQGVRSELGPDGTDVFFGSTSPDGERLVVGYQQGDLDDPISGNLAVVGADGTDPLVFPAPQGRDLDPVWRPSRSRQD